jgi:hypothetical protein
MKKRELKRLKRIHNRHEYDHVKRIEKEKYILHTTQLGVTVFNVQFGRQILCERVSHHILGGTVNKDNFACGDAFTERMETKVDVLGAFTVNGIFRHKSARSIVFVQWSRG